MNVTIHALQNRAATAIKEYEGCIFEVARHHGQMVDNVKRMTWFKLAVMQWFIDNVKLYAHLKIEVDENRGRK